MPKRKRRPSKKRRRTKKFRKSSSAITSVRMGTALFPNEVFVRLKYHDNFSATGATAASFHAMRGNSLFDPDFSLGGHQPRGFDQYAAIYHNYQVFASKISYELRNNESSNEKGLVLHPTSTAPTNLANPFHAVELPYYQGPKHLPGAAAVDAHNVKFKGYMTTKKIYGDKDLEEDEYGALVTTNPNKAWFWNLTWGDYNTAVGVNSYNLSIYIKVTYFAKFYNRKNVIAS